VGYSSSGVDIARQIESRCKEPLLIPQKSAAGLSPGSLGFAEGKAMLLSIISFDKENQSVMFANGKEEKNVDKVVFCTGYNFEYPFLSGLPEFEGGKGDGNTETYQHVFYTPNPTLAFVLLPLRVVAFPFAESQAAAIARVWSGRLHLPSDSEMNDWVQQNRKRRGSGKGYHKLSYPADADYMNEMHDWCGMAQGESEGNGMPAPFWGNMDRWLRKNVHDIRRATEDKGEGRFDVKRVEDVGFLFENGKDGVGRTPPVVDTAS
jgi:hypothetical protein